jgi:hypothetical protein
MARRHDPMKPATTRDELLARQTPVVQRRGEHGWFDRPRRDLGMGEMPARGAGGPVGHATPGRRARLPPAPAPRSQGEAVRRGGVPGLRSLVTVAVIGGLVWAAYAYRDEIVRRLPVAYEAYRALGIDVPEPVGYGLAIPAESLRYFRIRGDDGQPALLVRGKLVNRTGRAIALPRVRFVATAPGMEPVAWTYSFSESELGPRREIEFSSTQRSPRPMVNVKVEWQFVPR